MMTRRDFVASRRVRWPPAASADPRRQALGPALLEIRQRRQRRRSTRTRDLRPDRPHRLRHRSHGLRVRLPRLRQRRLAGHPPAHRPRTRPPGDHPAVPQQSRRHVRGRHRELGPGQASGPPASRSAITTTTASTTSSSPAGAQNFLFHNNGDGTFTDVTEKAGLLHAGAHYGTGCTWIDYDRDGRLDLFVAHYLVFDPDEDYRRAARTRLQLQRRPGLLRPRRAAAGALPPLSQQRRRDVHRREREIRHRRASSRAMP